MISPKAEIPMERPRARANREIRVNAATKPFCFQGDGLGGRPRSTPRRPSSGSAGSAGAIVLARFLATAAERAINAKTIGSEQCRGRCWR